MAAQIAVDDAEITEVLLKLVQLTERNGIKLPREFGLLVKLSVYRLCILTAEALF